MELKKQVDKFEQVLMVNPFQADSFKKVKKIVKEQGSVKLVPPLEG